MDTLIYRQNYSNSLGMGLIEILVSITILGLVMAASTRMFINSISNQGTNRKLTRVESSVQNIFNTYRAMNYLAILDLFQSSYTQIENGATTVINSNSDDQQTNYSLTLTAIKTNSESIPEAIRMTVEVDQARNYFDHAEFQYETIISQVR
jgi:type II secretory pathway pseudopilin PulG